MVDKPETVPEIHAVVLNYKGWRDTIDCVNSLLEVNYPNFKIVIVDNDSQDESVAEISGHFRNKSLPIRMIDGAACTERLTRLGKIVLIQSGKNGGYGYGNNLGIKFALANGADQILILNNDTIVDPDFLSPLVKLSESDATIGMVSGKIYYFEQPDILWFNGGGYQQLTGRVRHFDFNRKDPGEIPPREITFITGCMMLIPRDVLVDVGLINEEYFMYLEDLEYSRRVLKSGYKLMISQASHIWHKMEPNPKKRLNNFKAYYFAKNKVKFLKENSSGFFRITALFYLLMFEPLILVLKRRIYLLKSHFRGLKDGLSTNLLERK